MASRFVYVGNIPNHLSKDDLAAEFKDFKGIEIQKIVKKPPKCYALLFCTDYCQALDVITIMNDAIVCGRNLVVRSCDSKYQNVITKCSNCQMEASSSTRTSFCARSVEDPETLPSYQKNFGTDEGFQQPETENPDDTTDSSAQSSTIENEHGCRSFCYDPTDYEGFNPKESLKIYAKAGGILDHLNNYERSYDYVDDFENVSFLDHPEIDDIANDQKLSYVSVMNFPFRTSVEDLYDLFSDYNPCDIVEFCNQRRDGNITEALVTFASRDDATNAILNLDNTYYRCRVIYVTDIKDSRLLPALINIKREKM